MEEMLHTSSYKYLNGVTSYTTEVISWIDQYEIILTTESRFKIYAYLKHHYKLAFISPPKESE